jgi:hypothetical protein
MGIDVGACGPRVSAVRSGNLVKKLLPRACSSVDRTGENKVACAYVTESAMVVPPSLFAWAWGSSWTRLLGVETSICHMPVGVYQVPVSTHVPLLGMRICLLLN